MLIIDLPLTRLAMEKLTVGAAPLSFNSQQYLAKSVSVLYSLYLKDFSWFSYCSLKGVPDIP